MALTPEQVYKLGAESLGWNNSTTAGKALIAEDMVLLQRLQLVNGMGAAGSSPTPYIRMAVPLTALAPSVDHRHRLRRRNRCLSRSVLAQMRVPGTAHYVDLCQL